MGKNKAPFYFPVFYNGLIDGRTLKSQKDAMNILFNGRTQDIPSQDEINSVAASKYIHGDEPVSRDLRETVRGLSFEEVSERIAMLYLHDAKTTAAAFHKWLRGNADISREELQRLEQAARASGEANDYIAEAFLASLYYTGRAKRIDGELKTTLRKLPKTADTEALFPSAPNALMPLGTTAQLADAAVPMIVNMVLSTLYGLDREQPDMEKLPAYERYRCANFLKITKKAEAELRRIVAKDEDSYQARSEFDFDWFLRFFEAVGNIRNEDMQDLWAKVLAGEIAHQGSFSLRTVETLRNMTAREALIFRRATRLILSETDGSRFLFCDDSIANDVLNERYGLAARDILTLEECGLVSALRMDNAVEIGEDAGGFLTDSGLILLYEQSGERTEFRYKSYLLSQTALELLPVARDEPDDDYLLDLGMALKEEFAARMNVSVYRVLDLGDDGEIALDLEHDLLAERA